MKNLLSNNAPAGCQRGMTLIEILVAIVVLSVGLLGLAGLQLKGVQVNQGSAYRWQAAMLAEDIADRMRADKKNALNSQYVVTANVPSGTGSAVTDWVDHVKLLPVGTATISAPTTANPATANQVTITITWADTRAQGGAGVPSGNGAYTKSGSYSVTVEL
jgi:type IV pilus assembly protein PilV